VTAGLGDGPDGDAGRGAGTLLVDARALHASGIGRYRRELLARWLRDPPFDRIALLGDPSALGQLVGAASASGAAGGDVRVIRHVGGFYSPAAQRSWLGLRRTGAHRCAAAFFPHWDAPLVGMPAASVVTVHDLIHFKVPDAFPPARRWVAARTLARVVARAAGVVTVSHATTRDLVERFPRAAGKVRTVANGVGAEFGREPRPDDAAVGAGEPYVLCVGNQKPHKNLEAAVEVLARVRKTYPSLRLVIAGERFPGAGRTLARAAELDVCHAVRDLGPVDDATLRGLYRGASVFLFPSRYEGFGIPVLEAMLAGAPVVASDTPAVAEVAGDAALLRAPDDHEGMAEAVAALLSRADVRTELVRRGRDRAARFSWDASARQTAAVLRAVASARAAPRRPTAGRPMAVTD
jgi:glycosyltransferase involved in cell wall biosynthesis